MGSCRKTEIAISFCRQQSRRRICNCINITLYCNVAVSEGSKGLSPQLDGPRCSLGLTVDELLLLVGGDADQMSALHATLSLCRVPAFPLGAVLVAASLELVPAVVTRLCI